MKTWLGARCTLFLALFLTAVLVGCGGGNSGAGGGNQSPPSNPALTITTPSLLPGTLINSAYSVSLQATNGVGALKWSIAPVSPTAQFVNGLSINPSTGVLSGTANFAGTAAFVATVSDSAAPPRTASQLFTISASSPLQAPPPQTFAARQYQAIIAQPIAAIGGVQPLTFSLSAGSLPFGLRLGTTTGLITGSTPVAAGNYSFTVTIQDSYSSPEVVTAQITIKVAPPTLSIANSLPQRLLLNQQFSGKVVAIGGIPPYKFTMTSGSLPPGLNAIDPNTGATSGAPTNLGSYGFGVSVSDSSSPPGTASANFAMTVANPLGRNDSPATATLIGSNGSITASISPYIDPPTTPLPGDNDYYKLVSLSRATVHVETFAQRWALGDPLDTVIEIVDGNGNQLTTCNQPGGATTNFSAACLNDDITTVPTTDSALDLQVPGAPSTATTFYVHVLDWRGDARPDMRYMLSISGLVAPLSIPATSLAGAARGLSYSQQLSAANGIGSVSWSVTSGVLPPGLTLSSSGSITGAATVNGTYTFSVQAIDSANPPQTATSPQVIQVVDPLQITSPAHWPDAHVNQPYTFAMQSSGGLPPLTWGILGYVYGINVNPSTGVASGIPQAIGTFTITVGVNDQTQYPASQQVTYNVVP